MIKQKRAVALAVSLVWVVFAAVPLLAHDRFRFVGTVTKIELPDYVSMTFKEEGRDYQASNIYRQRAHA